MFNYLKLGIFPWPLGRIIKQFESGMLKINTTEIWSFFSRIVSTSKAWHLLRVKDFLWLETCNEICQWKVILYVAVQPRLFAIILLFLIATGTYYDAKILWPISCRIVVTTVVNVKFFFKHLKSCHSFVNHSVPHVFPQWQYSWESHHRSLSQTLKAQWSDMSLLTRTVLCFILGIIYKFSNTFYTFKANVSDIWYWRFCFYFKKVKVKQSRYRPGVAQRVPGS